MRMCANVWLLIGVQAESSGYMHSTTYNVYKRRSCHRAMICSRAEEEGRRLCGVPNPSANLSRRLF